MAIDNDLAVTMREAVTLYTAPAHVEPDAVVETAVDDGVSLSLSAQGRLMAAVMLAAEKAGTAATVDAEAATTSSTTVDIGAVVPVAKPVTRATLLAIETRLAAGRANAGAVEQADRELPPSSDPQRLRQAEQATQSLYGRAPNPFAGMSRAALADIVYDESGTYTINERYAAAAQRAEIDRTYWTPLFQRAQASGDWRAVIEAGIAFYNNLTPLEQTAYPANYLQLMQQYLVLANVQPPTSAPSQSTQQPDLWLLLTNLILPTGRLSVSADALNRHSSPATAVTAAAAQTISTEPLKVDGYLLLLQRVFGLLRRMDEPPVATRASLSAQSRDFLSVADRRFLARAYGYAAVNGIALDEVDGLAVDLAGYRFVRASGGDPESKPGALWNVDGSPRYYRMDAEDTALAQRMLTSRAAQETELDHGFLAYLLNPRGGGWMAANARGHAISLPILDQLLNGLMRLRGGAVADFANGEQVNDRELEPAYRYALARLGEQDIPDLPPGTSADNTIGARILAMAALVRSDALEMAQFANALSMLRMYRYALKMNEGDQRLLSELVYGSMRWRRMQKRRTLPVPRLHWLQR